jgi:Trk K+ transport system NAD-binding subunit
MSSIFFIVLRRMRAPLIVLIVIYAVSVLGLTLVPGVDANGQPAPPLSFFHAFYFISYTATTIGFGEIPNAFSDAQRLWVTVCIYLTVIGWSYSIVTLLALFQDKAFQSVLVVGRFARRVRHLHEPFYLVCGCGETGALVCRTLDELNIRFVVVEAREERVQELDLEDFKTDVPALAADAQAPKVLQMAGLLHPKCLGVLALTNDDNVNLAIAISTRLLNPGLTVLARAENSMTAANMASFGTHHIINPFERFADYLGLALEAPHTIRLLEWVTGLPGRQMPPMHRPPSGAWVVCGHGRFSRPVVRELAEHDLQVTVITPEAMDAIAPPLRNVIGLGVRAETLCEAGVAEAVGLVAGTDNDVNNLSIAVTAKAMNPDLFVVLRQNRITNASLFEAYGAQFTMVPSRIIAHESMAMIITPLLARFLDGVRGRDDDWAAAGCARMEAQFGDEMPQVWSVRIDDQEAPALTAHLKDGGAELSITTRGFELNNECLDALPLMLVGSDRVSLSLFPAGNMPLHCGDELLFAGRGRARDSQRTLLSNANILAYLLTGRERPGGWIWQEYGKKLD